MEVITHREAKIPVLTKLISNALSSFHTTAASTAQSGEQCRADQRAWKGGFAIENTTRGIKLLEAT